MSGLAFVAAPFVRLMADDDTGHRYHRSAQRSLIGAFHEWHLRFYTYETRTHHGISVYEWLLERAKKQGIRGGSAFRAMAGFGRHGKLHEQHFLSWPAMSLSWSSSS